MFLRTALSCACSFVFLYGVDSKAYLAAALWCCGFVRLWLWSWGLAVAHTSHPFPFFFHALHISLFLLCYCSIGFWVLISIVPWLCISAIMQFTALLVFGFVLSCFRGALAEVLGSYNFVLVPKTNRSSERACAYVDLVVTGQSCVISMCLYLCRWCSYLLMRELVLMLMS